MNDDNLSQRHRHGKVWRDLDGNIVEPMIGRGWGWVLYGLAVLILVLAVVVLFVRDAAK